ncbi:MAG: helix-turn-helix domain-containing protein [Lachnospiraceae bacterium]|nr:helix-turn-helix domain-containing protein [Lachnospiraceae bacterium]
MEALLWETPEEIDKELAIRVRRIRKRRQITQEVLSRMSGVSYGSIKRFETTGKISLLSLTKIALALDCANEIKDMFTEVPYRSIEEVINENK